MSGHESSDSARLRQILKSVSLKNDKIHVYSLKNEWAVKKESGKRALKTVKARRDAIDLAKIFASKSKAIINHIIVHDKKGSIEPNLSETIKRTSSGVEWYRGVIILAAGNDGQKRKGKNVKGRRKAIISQKSRKKL
ncbi:MAG: DUF2188 domain-containing protein [Deltaproteobacteria bacterium]|nr:DUF2188 domain-containing protein [Deltaproteobacteria bacterium]MCL4873810.1 DUF2188 domain-containing protein [bacterium]